MELGFKIILVFVFGFRFSLRIVRCLGLGFLVEVVVLFLEKVK